MQGSPGACSPAPCSSLTVAPEEVVDGAEEAAHPRIHPLQQLVNVHVEVEVGILGPGRRGLPKNEEQEECGDQRPPRSGGGPPDHDVRAAADVIKLGTALGTASALLWNPVLLR